MSSMCVQMWWLVVARKEGRKEGNIYFCFAAEHYNKVYAISGATKEEPAQPPTKSAGTSQEAEKAQTLATPPAAKQG